MKENEKLNLVFCVTSYGKLIGVYADSKDAYDIQMITVNKGRIAELVAMPVIYPETLKSK